MPKPYLRDLRGEAEQLQREVGDWVIAGVETTVPWPTTAQVVPYDGFDFILRPGTPQLSPTVCLNARKHGLTTSQAHDAVSRLGSAMAWSGDWQFEVVMWMSGSHPFGVGRMQMGIVQDFFDIEELASIPDDDAATALAFFREGVSSRSPFYGFLNLYKAIAFIHRDGRARGRWVDEALPVLTERDAIDRLDELRAGNIDPSSYLVEQGRHAIAHAERDVFVNPDKMGDHQRITRDLPVIRALARMAIEEKFGIHHRLSRKAVRSSPIAGFRALLGQEVIDQTLDGIDLSGHTISLPNQLTVLVRRGADVHAFEDLTIRGLKQLRGSIGLWMQNAEGTLQATLVINLENDSLEMAPDGIECLMNANSRSSVDQALKAHQFSWTHLRNGRVELWSPDDTLLGKTAPYMPVNAMANPEWHTRSVAELTAMRDAAPDP
ncbi:methylamine utilization protein MauJ [Luteibacter sp. 329MFSha]|uniref:methylamine utilization protein MauJ n=1 Tax=Luteibacter sp. 329MFSha TaxID=1798239 RepID=UPI0008C5AB85|nr:methylamine utilization protein MauJ [Luteibacter sp. 329MFSha]SEV89593.1 hypothetical protein SAMN04515660_0748 [Luteibacter sp. 329MFSha]